MFKELKRTYNKEDKIVVKELVEDNVKYCSLSLSKVNGAYPLKSLMLSNGSKMYLENKGIKLKEEYESIEEIQDIVDELDPWRFRTCYIDKIGDNGSLYVCGEYRYIGEESIHFKKGRKYYCSCNGKYVCMMIGDDGHQHSVDEDDFEHVKDYNNLKIDLRYLANELNKEEWNIG